MSRKGDALSLLLVDLRALGIPEPEPEYRFDPQRKWRFDLAWPDRKVAVEVDGGTWAGGRHTTGSGFARDCEKTNRAAILGWKVLRFTTTMVRESGAADVIAAAMQAGKGGSADV